MKVSLQLLDVLSFCGFVAIVTRLGFSEEGFVAISIHLEFLRKISL